MPTTNRKPQTDDLEAAWRDWIAQPNDSDQRVERLQLALDADISPARLLAQPTSSHGMEAVA